MLIYGQAELGIIRAEKLEGTGEIDMQVGDVFVIETRGGGGIG